MDDFLEQIAFKRNQGLGTLLYFMCWIGVFVFGIFAATSLMGIVGMNAEGGMSFNFVSLIIGLITGAIAFGLWRASDMCRVEYDYTFTNGVLDVSRVLNNRRRTYLTSLNVSDVIRCGPASGPAFTKALHEPNVKRHNWFVNREANLTFFLFEKKGSKHLIILELNDEMVALVRGKKYLQRGVWYEADGTQNYGKGIS